jgi:hypothetical protein
MTMCREPRGLRIPGVGVGPYSGRGKCNGSAPLLLYHLGDYADGDLLRRLGAYV